MLKHGPGVACALVLLGCDGGPSEPRPQFPEIAGTYQVSAPAAKGAAPWIEEGTVTITDDSRETPAFSGTYEVRLRDQSGEFAQSSGPLQNATVDAAGNLQFDFSGPEFRHAGKVSGRTITTEWLLQAPSGGIRGTMTASRP